MKKMNQLPSIDAEILVLKKNIKKTELKIEILKNAGESIPQAKIKIFDFMKENESRYSIRMMANVLCMDRREYQRWKKKPLNDTQQKKISMQQKIASIFYAAGQRYGSERIAIELQNSGYQLSSRTVRKYMGEMKLSALGKKN